MENGASVSVRGYGRSAGLLSVAVALAGALTYVFFALASHALDREDYGRVVVLWSVMFVAISVLFRPVEQLLSRTIAELDSNGQPAGPALRVAAQIQIAVAAAFLVVALVFRAEIEARLFDGDELFFWSLVASVLGFAASFYARGYLAGHGRFAGYSVLIVVDALAKVVLALAVAVGMLDGPDPIALGIAVAPGLSALLGLAGVRLASARAGRTETPSAEFTLSRGGSFAGAMVLVMLGEQVLLNSGILIVRFEDSVAASGFFFNVLMVARAPVVLFQAAATTLLPHLTRALAGEGGVDSFQASIRGTLLAVAGFAAVATVVVATAGPELMQLAFGDKFTYGRADLVIIAVGMGAFLAATTLNQAVIAEGKAGEAAGCWMVAAVSLVVWSLLPAFDVIRRVELGFTAASFLLALLLFAVYRRGAGAGRLEPGSAREREAAIAASGG
jgi:O-antigen/teichoic acid export membrane protein